MYFMMMTGQEFSYEKYNLMKSIDVFDIPVAELPMLNPDFKRYVRILENHSITSTSQMANAYLACELGPVNGLGRKFFITIRDFLNNQHKYNTLYNEIKEGGTQHES